MLKNYVTYIYIVPKNSVWSKVSEFSIINLSLVALFLFLSIVNKIWKSEGN